MKRLLFALIVLLGTSSAFGYGTPEQASWRVRAPAGGNRYAYGSCTAVGSQVMVTAGHVVDWTVGTQVDVYRPDGRTGKGHCISAARDPIDMAVIQLDNISVGEAYVSLGNPPIVGQTVIEYGYGHLGIFRTGTGVVTARLSQYEFKSSIIIESGDSGCGVFDTSGRIVGVNTSTDEARKTPDGRAITGPSVSTGINWLHQFSNLSVVEVGCPGGVCPINQAPGPPPSQMQPVVPWPSNPAPPTVPAPQLPSPAPSPGGDLNNRIGGIEGWINEVNGRANPILDRYGMPRLPSLPGGSQGSSPPVQPPPPVLPPLPAPQPVPPPPVEIDLSGIRDILQPIVDEAVGNLGAQIKNQIANQSGNLQDHLNGIAAGVKDQLPQVAGQVVNQIKDHPEIISAVVGPLLAGLGLPGWAATGVSGVGLALLGLLIHKKSGSPGPPGPPGPSGVNGKDGDTVVVPSTPKIITTDSPIPPQATVTQTHFVPVASDLADRASAYAFEQVGRKYPGSAGLIEQIQSLRDQFVSANS